MCFLRNKFNSASRKAVQVAKVRAVQVIVKAVMRRVRVAVAVMTVIASCVVLVRIAVAVMIVISQHRVWFL
jgi:hypothetical protein